VAFEAHIEKKWKDALNVAAEERQTWEAEAPKRDRGYQDRPAGGRTRGEKLTTNTRGGAKLVGAAKVVAHYPSPGFRRCKVQDYMGCGGNHSAVYCNKQRTKP
jgi:hypothetical protein